MASRAVVQSSQSFQMLARQEEALPTYSGMNFSGELAALTAAMCWTLGSQTIEAASTRVGVQTVNLMRLIVAVAFLAAFLFFRDGSLFPEGFSQSDFLSLAASGVIGLLLGDLCLFAAFVEIGPRLSLLIMSLSAPVSALIAYVMLGESYALVQCVGMFVALGGVALVILEKEPVLDALGKRKFRKITLKGFLLALGGMLGQAGGSVLSKSGMGAGDYMQATQVRLIAAMIGMVLLFSVRGWWPRVGHAARQPKVMGLIVFGGLVGTTLGIGFSMKSFQLIHVGLSSTLLSLVPIFLIPFAVFLHHEHVSRRAVAGTLIAFGGICLMMLVGS